MTGEQQPQHHHHDQDQHSDPLTGGEVEPRIYVASLSDYNAGHLHGAWLDADQPPEDLQDGIDHMLAQSTQEPAEEWAIHDHEGFGAFELGEYEQLDIVSLIAGGIARHGRPFSHWANITGTLNHNALERFDEHYRGHWTSIADYAEAFLDELGETPDTFAPGWLQPYVRVDYEALGQDLATDLETGTDPDGTIHLFEPAP